MPNIQHGYNQPTPTEALLSLLAFSPFNKEVLDLVWIINLLIGMKT